MNQKQEDDVQRTNQFGSRLVRLGSKCENPMIHDLSQIPQSLYTFDS